jgi:hypothetical protein
LVDIGEEVLLVDDFRVLFGLDYFLGHFLEVGVFLLFVVGLLVVEF